jgi:hypothetical protein
MIKNDLWSFPYYGCTYGDVTPSIFILTPSIFTMCLIFIAPKAANILRHDDEMMSFVCNECCERCERTKD